ncbi:HTTM domain-containing protein [Beggiatoa alba]|nr:HTTM domain-containing protein [Beggiatoa alba]
METKGQEWGHSTVRGAPLPIFHPKSQKRFAHLLAVRWEQRLNIKNVEVRVDAWTSLNGREKAILIDAEVDLVKKKMSVFPTDWISPLAVVK